MKSRGIVKLIRTFTFSHEKEKKLLSNNCRLAFRWQRVSRRDWLWSSTTKSKKKKKKDQFLVRNVLRLLHLVSSSNESLNIRALYHWNHQHAFSLVQKQYLFFNMYLQVPTIVLWALWVLRNIFLPDWLSILSWK